MPHRRRQQTRRDYLGLNQGDLVHLAGIPVAFAAEIDRVPANIDLIGRDGAIRFYFPDGAAEMLLFKYCGQP